MTHESTTPQYLTVARRLCDRGYRVIIGSGKGGFWVRNSDMTIPSFADRNSFVSFRKAKLLFLPDATTASRS